MVGTLPLPRRSWQSTVRLSRTGIAAAVCGEPLSLPHPAWFIRFAVFPRFGKILASGVFGSPTALACASHGFENDSDFHMPCSVAVKDHPWDTSAHALGFPPHSSVRANAINTDRKIRIPKTRPLKAISIHHINKRLITEFPMDSPSLRNSWVVRY